VPDQIAQVFINMFLNAVDAMAGKPGTIDVTIDRDDESVRISVADNGHGIEEENLPKIFEPFFTTKGVGQGTGLGLWVSYGIVKSFRGDITVESIAGRGTTFCATLPLSTKDY